MSKETLTNKEPKAGTTGQNRKPARMKDVATDRSDLPEYIKKEDLQRQFPFTIFSVAGPRKGRYGDYFQFGVAWKEGGEIVKKVVALNANDDRQELAYQVRKHGAITNCRLVLISLGETNTYWKVVDNDEPLPETVILSTETSTVKDGDIPF